MLKYLHTFEFHVGAQDFGLCICIPSYTSGIMSKVCENALIFEPAI